MNNTTTKQVKSQGSTRFGQPNGNPINKETQFGGPRANPRHNGAWKKEDTARFKLEQMLKLSEAELRSLASDPEAPLFERKLATCIAKGQWKEIEGMMNQVYGFPKQQVENHNIEMKPLVDLTKRKKNGN